MRIAFDVSYIQKYRAGIGRHALTLIKALLDEDRQNGYLLHGWSFGLSVDEISRLARPNTTFSLHRIPGNLKRFYWNTLRVPNIEALVGDVDLFHSTDPLLPPTAKAKTVCTVYDIAYKKFPALFERRVIRWGRYLEQSLQKANAIVVPSQSTKDDLVEMFGVDSARLHIVRVPAAETFAADAVSSDAQVLAKFHLSRPFLLSVGTVEPRKNFISVVKAFETLCSDTKIKLDVVLAGKKGWFYEDIFRAINDSSVRERILYLEYVDDRELAALYRRALFTVYPSLYEGYGFPVLEAMACGAPVITSNNSSMKEIAEGAAILVDPHSIEQLVDAMTQLVDGEPRRAELRKEGLRRAHQYTSASAAADILRMYEELG
jgi:glycosyltransferase involved in cell wall biosynthesis